MSQVPRYDLLYQTAQSHIKGELTFFLVLELKEPATTALQALMAEKEGFEPSLELPPLTI